MCLMQVWPAEKAWDQSLAMNARLSATILLSLEIAAIVVRRGIVCAFRRLAAGPRTRGKQDDAVQFAAFSTGK